MSEKSIPLVFTPVKDLKKLMIIHFLSENIESKVGLPLMSLHKSYHLLSR